MKVFVDASAVVAIIADEPDRQELHEKLKRYKQRHISGMVIYESVLALQRLGGSNHDQILELVQGFQQLYAFNQEPVAITQKVAEMAIGAFDKYGKGKHPARLNMGDCFSYACARDIKAKLLFKGNDFGQTDIEIA
jgi:ribonuclease VapC